MVWYGLCGSVLYCTVLWCAVYSVNVAVSMFLGSIILNQYAQLESMSRSHSNPIKIYLIDKQYTATASLRLLHLVWNNSNLWDIRFGAIGWHNLFSNGYWFNPFPLFLCFSVSLYTSISFIFVNLIIVISANVNECISLNLGNYL